jgi:hypothetical protein
MDTHPRIVALIFSAAEMMCLPGLGHRVAGVKPQRVVAALAGRIGVVCSKAAGKASAAPSVVRVPEMRPRAWQSPPRHPGTFRAE